MSSSPINPASSSLQNFWHGSVETSTDTLVPVIESHSNGEPIVISPSSIDDITVLPNKSIDLLNGSVAMLQKNGELKTRILPEVHYSSKLKTISQANGQTMDDSIVIQPEHQRMNISNGTQLRNDIQTNANANFTSAFTTTAAITSNHPASLYRRRRNSSNSRQSPLDLMSPNGMPSHRPTNGR